jgi:flagellar hook-basal body complex protein FliE
MNGIDTTQIAAMAAQMKTAVARMHSAAAPSALGVSGAVQSKSGVDFAQALRTQLDQVNALATNAEKLGERFSLGDDRVNLSDVMIASQKSSIAMQATIQVRNKLVSAYNDIMNMQV